MKFSTSFLALALVAFQASQGVWRAVALRLPADVPVAAVSNCIIENGIVAARATESGTVEAFCGPTSVLRCTVPGTEPLDTDLTALCQSDVVTLVPAGRSAKVTIEEPGPMRVEWRAPSQPASGLLATRAFEAARLVTLPLSSSARWLRVVRTGVSPVTFAIPAGDGEVAVTVPPATPGGELFVVFGESERLVPAIVISGPVSRVIELNGQAFTSVPGLAAGDYTLRLGTVEDPKGPPVSFSMVEAATTEVAPAFSSTGDEPRISGLVTLNGKPLASATIDVTHVPSDTTVTAVTDALGRYTIGVAETGIYAVRLATEYDVGQAEAQSQVGRGETQINLAIEGTTVRLSFTTGGLPPTQPVNFVVEGPQRITGTASDFTEPVELFALPFGAYTVRASMDPALVSRVESVKLESETPVVALTLDLAAQTASLRVVDASGQPVTGARARTGTQILPSSGPGTIDVTRVSPGVELIVRAPKFLPGCLVLQADIENRVVLVAEGARLEIRFENLTPRVPPGRVRLREGETCTVPLEEFDWVRTTSGFEIRNLPTGAPSILEIGDQKIPLNAPGEVVIIRM